MRDSECADAELCFVGGHCAPRDAIIQAGATVGEECTTTGGVEQGCGRGEPCRLGFCGDHGGDGPIPGYTPECTSGSASNGAPLFGGVALALSDGPDAVELEWLPAADETRPEAMHYAVFVSTEPGGEDFSSPSVIVEGATQARITGLVDGTRYFFIVRASDASWQTECNTMERSAMPSSVPGCVGFEGGVQPILELKCVDCHVGPAAPRGLELDTFEHVLRGGRRGGVLIPCDAGASLLASKVRPDPPIGRQMPPGGPFLSDNQMEILARWVDGGAVRSCATGPARCLDRVAPFFAGLAGIGLLDATTARLCWGAGADDVTPPSELRYDAYQATDAGEEQFIVPSAVSPPGRSCMDITELTPGAKYCWVVRARDAAGNHDGNVMELCTTVPPVGCVDYGSVIQPIFDRNCTYCHGGRTPLRELRLISYEGVLAGGMTGPIVVPCDRDASLLFAKISSDDPPVGVRMPVDGPPYLGDAAIEDIGQWIDEGARRSCAEPTMCTGGGS